MQMVSCSLGAFAFLLENGVDGCEEPANGVRRLLRFISWFIRLRRVLLRRLCLRVLPLLLEPFKRCVCQPPKRPRRARRCIRVLEHVVCGLPERPFLDTALSGELSNR